MRKTPADETFVLGVTTMTSLNGSTYLSFVASVSFGEFANTVPVSDSDACTLIADIVSALHSRAPTSILDGR